MKKHGFSISNIALSVLTLPLWFVKMFAYIGHLPDQATGEIIRVIFRHSMLENVEDLTHPVLPYVAMAIAVFSAVTNAMILRYPNNKAIKVTANIAFGISMGLFLSLLLLASTVARGY